MSVNGDPFCFKFEICLSVIGLIILGIILLLISYRTKYKKSNEKFYTGPYRGYSGYNYDYDLKNYYMNPRFL